MKIRETTEEAEKEKSLKRLHYEAGATGITDAGGAYQAASMTAAGAGYFGVGMLSSLTNLVTAFLNLKIPSIIRLMGSRKKAVLVLSFLDALGWLPIIALMLWAGSMSPFLLTVFWMINLVPGMMAWPARATWIAELNSTNNRGRYLGRRSSITNALYLTSFYVMGLVLYFFSGEHIFIGFAIIFLMSFVANLFCFLIYTRTFEPPQTVQEDTSFGLVDFLRETSTRNMGRFIRYASLFSLTVYLAAPFFSVYMLKDLHFSYITFSIVASSELVAKIVAGPFWGRYADKIGNLKLLRIASLSIPIIPILWLVSPNVVYLVLVQLLSGTMWAGFDLCAPNFIYSSASPERRLRYILYYRTMIISSMALGSLIAVFLLNGITPILGSQILSLFLLSGLLRLAVVLIMFPKLREMRRGNQAYQEELVRVPTLDSGTSAAVGANRGLLYRPREWWQWFNKPLAEAASLASETSAAVGANRGLLYRPREWRQWFNKPLAEAAFLASETPSAVGANRGLLYRPREWRQFCQGLAMVPVAAEVPARVSVQRGLFYRPQQWAFFVKRC